MTAQFRKKYPTVIYISGPMRGVPDYNYPAFDNAARELRKCGYAVLNPAENFGGVDNYVRETYMRLDYYHVLQAEHVWVLPNWSQSDGARAEVLVALDCGIPIFDYCTGLQIFPKITTTNCAYE